MAKRATVSSGRTAAATAAILAGLALAAARGQTFNADQQQPGAPSYNLFNPTPESEQNKLKRRRRAQQRDTTTNRIGEIPTYGNPPGSGAGATGFNSSNVPQPAPPNPAAGEVPAPAEPLGGNSSNLPPTVPLGAQTTPPANGPSIPSTAAETTPSEATATDEFAPPAKPTLRKRKPKDTTDPFDPVGIRVGSFILKPAIELSGGYNSNPGELAKPLGSSEWIVAPELKLQSDWSQHALQAELRGSYTDYPGFKSTPSLNQPLVDSKVAARIDVSRQTKIELEGRFRLTTVNPSSPDLPAGLKTLPITTQSGATLGVTHTFNRLELGVAGTFDRITYANSQLTDGETFSNADRNYNQYGAKLRAGYELLPGMTPFVEFGGDQRIHDLSVDFSGVHRDSVGEATSVGSTFDLAHELTGSLSVGYAARSYNDPTLKNFGGVIADGKLAWAATPLTTLTFTARSTIDESTLAGVSGELDRDFGVQLDHSFRRWLIGTLKFGYGWTDYIGSTRLDQRYAAAAQITYKMSRDLWLKGEYRHEWQTSNFFGESYAADIFLAGIRLQR